MFEHGQLATTFGAWPFSMRFNGERAAIAGVTAVGTLPTKRRRGYLRAAMEYSLTEQYERGQSLAALYASQAAIYQRFGYAVCSNRCSYEIDPLDLHFIHYPEPRGELSVSNAADLPDDAQVIRDLYRAFAAPRHGLVHRGRDTWDAEALAEPDDIHEGPIRCLLYEEDGQPLGYMLYTSAELREYSAVTGGQRDHRRRSANTAGSPRRPTSRCGNSSRRTTSSGASTWPTPQKTIRCSSTRATRARCGARPATGFWCGSSIWRARFRFGPTPPRAASASACTDDLCDWNDATWALGRWARGLRHPPDRRRARLQPRHSLNVAADHGPLSASYLARLGRLDVTNRSALARADAILRHRIPHALHEPLLAAPTARPARRADSGRPPPPTRRPPLRSDRGRAAARASAAGRS